MPKSAFSVEKPEDSAGLLLWQTTVMWQRSIKQVLDPHGISHAQFVILAILLWSYETRQEPTQILIAQQSKLDKMTVSKSLKRLAQQGFIERGESAKDSRAKCSRLTEKGKTMATKLVPLVEKIDADFFGRVDAQDQQSLRYILAKMVYL